MTIFNSSDNRRSHSSLKEVNDRMLETPEDREKLKRYLDKWNWGAALLSWIWALAHHKFGYAFLFFTLSRLPDYWGGAATLISMVVFGVYGNQWAWEEKQWKSLDEFIVTQKTWAKWGVVLLALGSCLWFFVVLFFK